MLPKVKSTEDIHMVDEMLTDRCMDTRLQVIIETNDALERAYDIAQVSL